MRRKGSPRLLHLSLIGLLVAGMGAAGAAAEREVLLEGNKFKPPVVEVQVGQTVLWRQVETPPHSVTTQPGGAPEEFDSHPECSSQALVFCMQNGQTFEFTFTKPGTYNYYCKIHGSPDTRPDAGSGDSQPCGMCGIIQVTDPSGGGGGGGGGGGQAPPPDPTAAPAPRAQRAAPTTAPAAEETAEETPEAEAVAELAGEALATPTPPPDDSALAADRGEGGAGRTVAAAIAAAALAGAAFVAWRNLFARSP